MNINEVEQKIKNLRDQKFSCSHSTLLGLAECYDAELPDQRILSGIVAGLRGGIGGTRDEGTCGALTAGVVALGLMFPHDNLKVTKLSRQLYEDFKNRFGTVICGKMTEKTGTARCTDCCLCAARKVAELYNHNSIEKV
ncbi:MAG: C-GCAxxG-C-C family protein [Muribaculaceae bacterium]|nr:C-GCAxxG-C-C family protein [Muribaculaceae bacterium]